MQLQYARDNMERMPYEHYMEQYQQTEPVNIYNRLRIPFDLQSREFTVMFLENIYHISHPDFQIRYEGTKDTYYPLEKDVYAKILVLRYLLNADIFQHNGKFRAYQEFPSGNLYYKQFQGRCIFRINRKYGNRLDVLEKVMSHLGALSIGLGDRGYEIEIFEGLCARFIFWEGDDEFPTASQILFSSNFPAAFSVYDLAEIGEICINTFQAIEKTL